MTLVHSPLARLVLLGSLAGAAHAQVPLADPLPDMPWGTTTVRLETVASGFIFPTHVVAAPDGSGRLFVVELNGIVRVVENGVVLATPFIDLSADFHPSLGSATSTLAFHPDFATNGRMFIATIEKKDIALADFGIMSSGVDQQSVLYELQASANYPAAGANVADTLATRELLRINEDTQFHNLDDLAFGPDGYLYAAKGDDVFNTAPQKTQHIHGKVIRIDVDFAPGNPLSANGEYAIPADNPFVGTGPNTVEEIFAIGFRNPWRMTFDGNDLWVADIGEAKIEEVNLVVAGGNYGWREKEGSFAFLGFEVSDDLSMLPPLPFIDPVAEYDHGELDASITGGVLYRGTLFPELVGKYVFADWVSARLFAMTPGTGEIERLPIDPTGQVINGLLADDPEEGVISVSKDAAGELLLVVTERSANPSGRVLSVTPGLWGSVENALAGVTGEPQLQGTGDLTAGSTLTLNLANAAPSAQAVLLLGDAPAFAHVKGGVLVPAFDLVLTTFTTDTSGEVLITAAWPPGLPPDFPLWFQFWTKDLEAPSEWSASNGLLAVTP